MFGVHAHSSAVTGIAVDPTGTVLASTGPDAERVPFYVFMCKHVFGIYGKVLLCMAECFLYARHPNVHSSPGNDCVTKWWSVESRRCLEQQTVGE